MENPEDFTVDDEIYEKFFKEPTPEELEERKRERREEIAANGFLPENEGYQETMHSPQEDVESNPKQFIIEECIPACKELWAKNIYTFMVSNHINLGECWIEIAYNDLSDENKEIYNNLEGEDVIKFSYHKGKVNFGVNQVGKEGQERLLKLAEQFQMQDVPEEKAYISLQKFLMDYCGCYDEVPNEKYSEMIPPLEMNLSLEEIPLDYILKYDDWLDSIESKKTIKQFNPDKLTVSAENIAQENGMIIDEDRVYLNEFHYKKHLNYVESLMMEQKKKVTKI